MLIWELCSLVWQEFIHYLQDSRYQRNIVRDYTVYDHEVRTGKNMKQAILRASQFAKSEPQGPVYIMASRECFEEELQPYKVDARKWKPIAPVALTSESVAEIGNALLLAEHPVVITTYLGRDKDAVGELVKLCEFAGIAVIEALPAYLNFPHSHRLYQGNEWTRPLESSPLESADFVLILDCDVPWIKSSFRPPASAKIYHIDCDPLKVNMSVFHADTELSCQGHIRTALQQLNAFVARAQTPTGFAEAVAARTQKLGDRHDLYMKQLQELEAVPVADETISPHYAVSVLRSLLDDSAIVLSEGISNYPVIADCMIRNKPGTYFSSGATSLGYHGGAAIGAKLASPSSTIVAVTGDGSYLFSVPSSVHWMSRQYDAPFLTVILNNGGWKSPMATTLLVHQKGHTSKIPVDDMNITFGSHCDYAQVAVAAGAGFGATVKRVSEVEKTLKQALETVKGGRSAVVDIWVPKFKVADCVK